MRLKRPPNYFVGIVVSVVCLWLAVRHIDTEVFLDAMRHADSTLIAIAFLITVIVCLLRVIRWRILFSFAQNVSTNSLFSVLMIGFLANNLLPARLGDVAMAVLLHHKEGIGKSRSMGAILLDRLFDVIALVSMMGAVLLFQDLPAWVDWIVRLGLIGCCVLFTIIWIMVRRPVGSLHAAEKLTAYLPKKIQARLMQIFVMALEGMEVVGSPARTVMALLASFLIWLALGVIVYILTLSYNFGLDFAAAITVLGIVNLGLIIPSSPGFVGTFQLFCVAALGLYGVDKSAALSFSVVYHLSQWLPTTVIGYYYLNRENMRLGSLRKLEQA